MKKISVAIATIAVTFSVLGGTASATGGGGGNYPPKPLQVTTPTPTIQYGSGLMAKASGLCYGVPAVFAVQDASDWTHRYFSPNVFVNPDGTAWYQFSASELSSFYGQVTVFAKQFGQCTGAATTAVTIKKDDQQPAPAPVGKVMPAGSAAAAPAAATPAAAAAPAGAGAAVLSSGVTAPAAAAGTTGSSSAASPARAAGDSLPVTGSDSSQTLQIALVAFAAGLGMLGVSSARRRNAAAHKS